MIQISMNLLLAIRIRAIRVQIRDGLVINNIKLMTPKKILKECAYKSSDWASKPVIAESLFREYDLRNPIKDVVKGGKPVPASVNEEGFRVLGQAYGTYAQTKLKTKKIIVANDYRYYSRGLAYAFITGVLSSGVDVIDIGTQLTPVMYF